jgi:hypothetical protein
MSMALSPSSLANTSGKVNGRGRTSRREDEWTSKGNDRRDSQFARLLVCSSIPVCYTLFDYEEEGLSSSRPDP